MAPIGRVAFLLPGLSMVLFTLGATEGAVPLWLWARLAPRDILIVPGLSVAFTCNTNKPICPRTVAQS